LKWEQASLHFCFSFINKYIPLMTKFSFALIIELNIKILSKELPTPTFSFYDWSLNNTHLIKKEFLCIISHNSMLKNFQGHKYSSLY